MLSKSAPRWPKKVSSGIGPMNHSFFIQETWFVKGLKSVWIWIKMKKIHATDLTWLGLLYFFLQANWSVIFLSSTPKGTQSWITCDIRYKPFSKVNLTFHQLVNGPEPIRTPSSLTIILTGFLYVVLKIHIQGSLAYLVLNLISVTGWTSPWKYYPDTRVVWSQHLILWAWKYFAALFFKSCIYVSAYRIF